MTVVADVGGPSVFGMAVVGSLAGPSRLKDCDSGTQQLTQRRIAYRAYALKILGGEVHARSPSHVAYRTGPGVTTLAVVSPLAGPVVGRLAVVCGMAGPGVDFFTVVAFSGR